MRYSAYIDIAYEDDSKYKIDSLLGVNSNMELNGNWIYMIRIEENDDWIDYCDIFHTILFDKIDLLDKVLGISKNQITIWLIVEYDQQCNFEFSSMELSKLGSLGITFCVSCYGGNLETNVI